MFKNSFEKVYAKESKKINTISEILKQLEKEPLSIAELSRRLKMNRSTLRYYLQDLKAEQMIFFDTQQEKLGRPTLISINEEHFKKKHEVMMKRVEEYKKEMEGGDLTIFLLKKLMKDKEIGEIKLNQIATDFLKERDPSATFTRVLMTTAYLKQAEFMESNIRLTEKGKELLKDNETKKT